jgi:hypothetical protein
VLASAIWFTAAHPPGAESEGRREKCQMGGGDSPQYRQECIDAKTLGKRPEPWLAAGKTLGHQPLERIQRGMDGLNAPAHPAQHTRQLDLQAQIRTRRLQAPGLLDVTDQAGAQPESPATD